jgi:hypothetical protein
MQIKGINWFQFGLKLLSRKSISMCKLLQDIWGEMYACVHSVHKNMY